KLISALQSSAYVDMTLNVLNKFGADIERSGDEFLINPIGTYKSPKEYIVEGDWSNAAFFMVMGALGGEITIKNLSLNSSQSDKRILDILKLSGVKFETSAGAIRVYKSKIKPFDYDVSQCPDLFPIMSILACGAEGKSTLYNAKRLRIKESDRITTTKELILNLGGRAEETEDSLTIYGNGKLEGGRVNSANDHRIAMSAFAASSISGGCVVLERAEAMDKSYPSFIEDFRSLGGMASVI
ncbi:MAG: 3-phosphoshikimate 1-carboxyvinyltransferase, partial [Clostridia bacterium]|nr:3-phosphoshikimate 1-carboxyvinyltransferase [Clostridia bacterium]